MKASDLNDVQVLHVIERTCVERDGWSNTTLVAEACPDAPFKVVAAKLSKLLRRGMVTGCDCGCRGDWELTTKGREFAGIPAAWRNNPCE